MKIPEPKAKLDFRTHVELRFNDFDMLGHLNNAVYLELTDLAKARYMQELLGEIDWRNLDLAIVNINSSFYAQIFPDDHVDVLTGVQAIGDHSFTLEQRIVDRHTGKVFMASTSVFCAFDPHEMISLPLYPALRSALEKAMA
ncbi:MAG: acyl-CoA thioesterase [Muribaculaceae bacterium]|nr:acyl-CoA thioesterase [Muribaculaceae bacterium]